MSAELDELAATAAGMLVTALAGDSWEDARQWFGNVIGQEARLAATRDELAKATGGPAADAVFQAQVRAWTVRLRDALDEDPATARTLQDLVGGMRAQGLLNPPAAAPRQAPPTGQKAGQPAHAPARTPFMAAVVVVALAVTVVVVWAILSHKSTSAATAGQGPPTTPGPESSAAASVPAADSLTQTFPDGTKVTLVSADWTALSTYDQAPYGVKFTYRIVAGPQWSPSGKVRLCPNCGAGQPVYDYMVTVPDWSYPATNSTGYADLVTGITTAAGVPEPVDTAAAADLEPGDSVTVSSTLVPTSDSPGEQQVTVTIEMPDSTLASETFHVNIGPNPNG